MSELTVRVYTNIGEYNSSRTINLNDGELTEMIGNYLRKERYLLSGEDLTCLDIEEFRP